MMGRFLQLIFICLITAPTLADEDLDFMFGILVGHVTMQLGELEVCKRRFPEDATHYAEARENYLSLMSADLDAVRRATIKSGLSDAYELLVEEGLVIGPQIATGLNEIMEKIQPGAVHAKCRLMLKDVKDGAFRRGAILLRPLSKAEPDAWVRVQSYLKN